jgi:hypothetical protein
MSFHMKIRSTPSNKSKRMYQSSLGYIFHKLNHHPGVENYDVYKFLNIPFNFVAGFFI